MLFVILVLMKQTETNFSLKDQLFNKDTVTYLADLFVVSDPKFPKKKFINKVLQKFPELELKQRIIHIRDILGEYLDDDITAAMNQIIKALPPKLDMHNTDNDFGDFIMAPLGYFVVQHGCTTKYIQQSLETLLEITQRFSMEGPVRYCINTFPKETFSFFKKHINHPNYHVRRWISESTRPLLPWEMRIETDYIKPIPFLDILYTDSTRYVTRSVANHLNDIAKIDPGLVIATLKKWHTKGGQSDDELGYITRHALRTLVKQGNLGALELLGYTTAKITPPVVAINTPRVVVGSGLEFSCSFKSRAQQNLIIDYVIYFRSRTNILKPKVFKITTLQAQEGEEVCINKNHTIKIMTTKTLYPGEHQLSIQINGVEYEKQSFELVEPDN